MHLLEKILKFSFATVLLIATLCITHRLFSIDVFISIHMCCMSNENIKTVNARNAF